MRNPVGIFDSSSIIEGWFSKDLQIEGWVTGELLAIVTIESGNTLAIAYYVKYMAGL